ncbi:MAG TPA: hypothetical protein VFP68_12135 [Burkholderiaceae bacterium]|nr:hypothetical protein [Burkholderiaceae bacterium]
MVRRFWLSLAVIATLFASGAAQAHDVSWSVSIGSPGYVSPAPVYVAPAPVVYAAPVVYPPAVVVRPAPVYAAPPVVYGSPVYVQPAAPAVWVQVGGHGGRHHHHHHGWRGY